MSSSDPFMVNLMGAFLLTSKFCISIGAINAPSQDSSTESVQNLVTQLKDGK